MENEWDINKEQTEKQVRNRIQGKQFILGEINI